MKRFLAWTLMILFLVVVGGGLYLWWRFDLRWRPHVITKNQTEIAKILDGSGWISPGLTGPKLYVIAHHDCAACDALEAAQFADLQKAGIDTRVIAIARPDVNGQAKSTAAERSTVAELWVNRSWGRSTTALDRRAGRVLDRSGHTAGRWRRGAQRRCRGRPRHGRPPKAAAEGQRRRLRLSDPGLVDQGRQDGGMRLPRPAKLEPSASGARGQLTLFTRAWAG